MSHLPPHSQDPLEEAIAAFRNLEVSARPNDADVVAKLTSSKIEPAESKSSAVRKSRWPRLLVSSLVGSTCLGLLLAFFFLGNSTAAALDEVIRETKKHALVRYQQLQTTEMNDGLNGRTESIVHADLSKPRTRKESRHKKGDVETAIIEIEDGTRRLMLDSETKQALLTEANKDYQSFLGGLEEWKKKKGVRISAERLQGRAVQKFRLQEGDTITLLWVDAVTKLPVRLDYHLIHPTEKIALNRYVWTDFQWDPTLPKGIQDVEELFRITVPKDYILEDQTPAK